MPGFIITEYGKIGDDVLDEYGRAVEGITTEFGKIVSLLMPAVTTNPASAIAADRATLNGTLDNDGEEACACGFEWGATPALGNTTIPQNYTTGQSFWQLISGLNPGIYYFRAFATNSVSTGYGVILSFVTLAPSGMLSVLTLPATLITQHSARIHGMVIEDLGQLGDVRFQWGATAEYGAATSWLGGFVAGNTFWADLSNLAEGSAFHYRAQFKNKYGLTSGQDMAFATLVPLGPITLITDDELLIDAMMMR